MGKVWKTLCVIAAVILLVFLMVLISWVEQQLTNPEQDNKFWPFWETEAATEETRPPRPTQPPTEAPTRRPVETRPQPTQPTETEPPTEEETEPPTEEETQPPTEPPTQPRPTEPEETKPKPTQPPETLPPETRPPVGPDDW